MLPALLLSAALGVSFEPTSPSLPVFGGGKLVNIFDDDAALTNASAHVAWSLALPLGGYVVGGRRGMWVAGLSWIGAAFLTETFFHAPARPGPAYPSEVRADLLTKVIPCAAVLAWDLFRSRGGPEPYEEEAARKAREPRPPPRPEVLPVGFPEVANALLTGRSPDDELRPRLAGKAGPGARAERGGPARGPG